MFNFRQKKVRLKRIKIILINLFITTLLNFDSQISNQPKAKKIAYSSYIYCYPLLLLAPHLLVGITIDIETDTIEDAPQGFSDSYDEIFDTAQRAFHSVLHLDQALKEHYTIPEVTVNGKQ